MFHLPTPAPDEPLSAFLARYAGADIRPWHMPGHKRRGGQVDPALPWERDFTEVKGLDDLHGAEGILKDAQARAARLYGAGHSWFVVGGSTCGLQAAVTAVTRPGDTILAARNCHKALCHIAELRGLRVGWVSPAQAPGVPFCGSLPPEAAAAALKAYPEAKALVITSPTYEGILSDIPALAALCHQRGIPLIVDEAHGAHLGFEPFPAGALAGGADLVAQSLHKTLPALTQSALLHLQGDLVSRAAVDHALDMLETSSPSYILMASMDSCLRWLESGAGQKALRDWWNRLFFFEAWCASLERLPLYTGESLSAHPGFCHGKDPSKLVIGRGPGNWDGPRLAGLLRRVWGMETEMAQPDYLLAMTSPLDEEEDYRALVGALETLEEKARDRGLAPAAPALPPSPLPKAALEPARALAEPWEELPWPQAVGRVSAAYLWAYPPGIPWLVPGEVIGPEQIGAVLRAAGAGVSLRASRGSGEKAAVLKEKAPSY